MSFTTSTILDLTVVSQGTSALVSWTTSAASGTWFQVYVDRVLTAWTKELSVAIPLPTSTVQVVVGSVDDGNQQTDYSSSITAVGNIVELKWYGGTFESAYLQGFHVYGSPSPGLPVDYSKVLATITAFPQGIPQGGWGIGGWGQGGWGSTASSYSWTSSRLSAGTWYFAVKPFDEAGNEGTASVTGPIVIIAPPNPPALNSAGKRLSYSNFHSLGTSSYATLNWLPSPAN